MNLTWFKATLVLATCSVGPVYALQGTDMATQRRTDYDRLLEEGLVRSAPEVEKLTERMPQKAEEIRSRNRLIWSRDLERAREAIPYFASLKAGGLVALVLQHPADDVQAQATSSLAELGHKAFVPDLLRTLKKSQVIAEGGSEQQVARSALVRALISALADLTEQDFGEVDVRDFQQVNGVIARCEAWLAAQEFPWLEREVTPVEHIRPALEAAAVELVKSLTLQKEIDRHLTEVEPVFDPDAPVVEKLEILYAHLSDHGPGLAKSRAGYAVELFSQMKAPGVLMEALKHPSVDVQGPAVRALGDLGYRPAVQPLVHLLRRYNFPDIGDEDYTIRTMFREQLIAALGKITRLDFVGVRPDDLGAVEEVAAKCESWAAEYGVPPHATSLPPRDVGGYPAVSVRQAATVLGYSVTCNPGETECLIRGDEGLTVRLVEGSTVGEVNGRPVGLPTAPTILDGRMYVPLTFIAHALKFEFSLDSEAGVAYIWPAPTTPAPPVSGGEEPTQPTG